MLSSVSSYIVQLADYNQVTQVAQKSTDKQKEKQIDSQDKKEETPSYYYQPAQVQPEPVMPSISAESLDMVVAAFFERLRVDQKKELKKTELSFRAGSAAEKDPFATQQIEALAENYKAQLLSEIETRERSNSFVQTARGITKEQPTNSLNIYS